MAWVCSCVSSAGIFLSFSVFYHLFGLSSLTLLVLMPVASIKQIPTQSDKTLQVFCLLGHADQASLQYSWQSLHMSVCHIFCARIGVALILMVKLIGSYIWNAIFICLA